MISLKPHTRRFSQSHTTSQRENPLEKAWKHLERAPKPSFLSVKNSTFSERNSDKPKTWKDAVILHEDTDRLDSSYGKDTKNCATNQKRTHYSNFPFNVDAASFIPEKRKINHFCVWPLYLSPHGRVARVSLGIS